MERTTHDPTRRLAVVDLRCPKCNPLDDETAELCVAHLAERWALDTCKRCEGAIEPILVQLNSPWCAACRAVTTANYKVAA